jgi:hypothetical protein
MHVPKENTKKLETHALEGIIVGYDGHSKSCWCYNLQHRKIIVTRDVKFDYMSIVTLKTITKLEPILWPIGDDFMLLKQTHMKTHTSNEVRTNLISHITTQKSHDSNQDKEKKCSKTDDMGDKLPHGISNEGMEVPTSSPLNSLSTPPMARGGVKAIDA